MKLAELNGEKSLEALAKRLLAQPSKTSSKQMEVALLRLNPHLNQIGDLEKGTPILVPEEFGLAADESVRPLRGMAEELLRQTENVLTNLRATLKAHAAQSAEQSDRVQTWLKSEQAKEFLRRSPELKKIFSSAAAAARTVPKEQATAIAEEVKALNKVQSELAAFRSHYAGEE